MRCVWLEAMVVSKDRLHCLGQIISSWCLMPHPRYRCDSFACEYQSHGKKCLIKAGILFYEKHLSAQ